MEPGRIAESRGRLVLPRMPWRQVPQKRSRLRANNLLEASVREFPSGVPMSSSATPDELAVIPRGMAVPNGATSAEERGSN